MAPHVSENLSRIKRSASELNKLADEATEQIRALGTFLDDISPGIEFEDGPSFYAGREDNSVNVTTDGFYFLGYGRDDSGRFGLIARATAQRTTKDTEDNDVVVRDEYDDPEYETVWVQRLDQLSRPIRIAAVARLPEFIEGLSNELEKAVETAKSNLEKVRAATDELRTALGQAATVDPSRFIATLTLKNGPQQLLEGSTIEEVFAKVREVIPDAEFKDPESADVKRLADVTMYPQFVRAIVLRGVFAGMIEDSGIRKKSKATKK